MKLTKSAVRNFYEIYKPYISAIDSNQLPDILFLTIPPPFKYNTDGYNDTSYNHPSTGLAYLSTQIHSRSNYKSAICYANQIQILLKNGKYGRLDVKLLTKLCINSNAKIIGFSLMSPFELRFVSKLIDQIKLGVKKVNLNEPEFIAGGAQATLDPIMTSRALKIQQENIFLGRALPSLLEFLDKRLGGSSNIDNIDYSAPVLPEFLIIKNCKEMKTELTPILSLIKSGGKACIGREPCSFCTAYFIGKSDFISDNNYFTQIDWLNNAGIKKVLAGDNVIDLNNIMVRDIVIRRIRYAHEMNVPIKHFLTRADFISTVPVKYIESLRRYSVESIMLGVETGNIETLTAMKKVKRGLESHYLEACKIAAIKMTKSQIKPTFNAIIGYPVNNEVDKIADKETIYFLIELLKLTNYNGNIAIHPLFISPGSEIHEHYIRNGATPIEILNFTYNNEKAFYRYKDNIVKKHGKTIEQFIFESNNEVIEDFLSFVNRRRKICKKKLGCF